MKIRLFTVPLILLVLSSTALAETIKCYANYYSENEGGRTPIEGFNTPILVVAANDLLDSKGGVSKVFSNDKINGTLTFKVKAESSNVSLGSGIAPSLHNYRMSASYITSNYITKNSTIEAQVIAPVVPSIEIHGLEVGERIALILNIKSKNILDAVFSCETVK